MICHKSTIVILYANLPLYLIDRMQKIQNTAARIISRTHKFDHITPVCVFMCHYSSAP